jgi:hypothetical protein
MCSDVALAFDRIDKAARADGVTAAINSGYRSDAEQAELFRRHPRSEMGRAARTVAAPLRDGTGRWDRHPPTGRDRPGRDTLRDCQAA